MASENSIKILKQASKHKNIDNRLKNIYESRDQFYVAVDCIIFGFRHGTLKLLAFNRNLDPFKGQLSLLGSFITLNESIEAAAKRTLFEITGLKDVYTRELKTYSAVDRDPGYRCISVAHYALIHLTDEVEKITKSKNALWFDVDTCPDLIMDHNIIVADALYHLEDRVRRHPIGFELLPRKFTIPQLQSLYEAIYRKELDPRNFRKKILTYDLLTRLNEKDKSTSKKGAFLYKFDSKKYKTLEKSGFNFEI